MLQSPVQQSPLQWNLPADAAPDTLSRRRSQLLPGLLQLAVAMPRCGRATAALEALCGLQEAAELDSSTAAGLLTAALQVRVCDAVGLHPGLHTCLCICALYKAARRL
jgi:hypothetical protein